jgi:hypothetical protein
MGEIRSAYKICIVKSEDVKPVGKPRLRWDDNIKKDLKQIVPEGVDWIHVAL